MQKPLLLQPLESSLRQLIAWLERLAPGLYAAVLLLDDERQTLSTAVAPSLPEDFNRAIQNVPIGATVGSCGAAAFTGKPVIIENTHVHSNWAPFRDLVKRAGVVACWSQPLLNAERKTLGTLAFYFREARKPTEFENALHRHAADITRMILERHTFESRLLEQQRQLQRALARQTILLREINHRTKNNLQIISCLVSSEKKKLGSPEAKAALDRLDRSIGSVGRLYSLLSDHEVNAAEVDLKKYIGSICRQLEKSVGDNFNVRIVSRCDSVICGVEMAVSVGLIVNELVANSLQHAFPDRSEGRIELRLFRGTGDMRLTISDNGRGVLEPSSADGLGTELVQALAQDLAGRLAVRSSEKAGTTIELTFPVEAGPEETRIGA